MRRWLPWLIGALLLTQDLIDLELAHDLGGWHANAPLVDLIGLAVLPIGLWGWWRRRSPTPGAVGFTVFLIAALLSVQNAGGAKADALHFILRKPLFLYLAYGVSLTWCVARALPRHQVAWMVAAWASATSLLSLGTSAGRIASGDALWFQSIQGITPNHKTLAVALAGGLPLVIGLTDRGRLRRLRPLILGLVGLAILTSAAKTAWITALVGAAWFWPTRRPLARRWRLTLPALGAAVALAYYAPVLMGSKTMLDAARSRHSLNKRAWQMFVDHPLVGTGAGMNVHVEQVTFPDYRVNGVDAHGAVQKVGSETGLIGLAGFGLFVIGTGLTLRRRAEVRPALAYAWGTWATLHCNLLLSTETFSATHWVPLAVAWGLAHQPAEDACAS